MGSIENVVLYVKEILATQQVGYGVNSVYQLTALFAEAGTLL